MKLNWSKKMGNYFIEEPTAYYGRDNTFPYGDRFYITNEDGLFAIEPLPRSGKILEVFAKLKDAKAWCERQ